MNARITNRFLCVCSAAAVAITAPRVWSQTLNNRAAPTGGASTLLTRQSILDRDERLRQKVTIARRDITLPEVLRTLRRETGVRLITDQDERMNLSLRDLPLKDVMDAIATLNRSVWERVDKDTYRLRRADDESSPLLPRSELERAKFQDGLQFVQKAESLSQDVRRRMAEVEGVRLADLPIPMQDLARRMLAAEIGLGNTNSSDDALSLTPDTLGLNAIVRLDKRPSAEFNDYSLVVGNTRGGMNISFNDLEQVHRRRAQEMHLAATTDPPRKSADVAVRGSKQDATMRQITSLTLRKATPPQALRQLAEQTGMNFVTCRSLFLPGARDVALPAMPLSDLLDRLLASYQNDDERMTWTVRESGVVVAYLEAKPLLPPDEKAAAVGASH